MAKRTQKEGLVKHSIECNCGDVISVRNPDDLQRAKLEHMYAKHPLELAKGFVKSVPNIRKIGESIGEFLRENLK